MTSRGKRWTTALGMGLLTALTACGAETDPALGLGENDTLHMAPLSFNAVGPVLDGQNRWSNCTGVLIAADVVLTSGRCAAMARGGGYQFALGAGAHRGRNVSVVHAQTLGVPEQATLFSPGWAQESHRLRGADLLFAACGHGALYDLACPRPARACLTAQDPDILRAAGVLGLSGWNDIGLLVLVEPFPPEQSPPARLAPPGKLDRQFNVQSVGIDVYRGLRTATLRRTFKPRRIIEQDATEFNLGTQYDDVFNPGSVVMAQPQGDPLAPHLLLGVASRPYMAHGDLSAGLIFTRLDAHHTSILRALQDLCDAGVRKNCMPASISPEVD